MADRAAWWEHAKDDESGTSRAPVKEVSIPHLLVRNKSVQIRPLSLKRFRLLPLNRSTPMLFFAFPGRLPIHRDPEQPEKLRQEYLDSVRCGVDVEPVSSAEEWESLAGGYGERESGPARALALAMLLTIGGFAVAWAMIEAWR